MKNNISHTFKNIQASENATLGGPKLISIWLFYYWHKSVKSKKRKFFLLISLNDLKWEALLTACTDLNTLITEHAFSFNIIDTTVSLPSATLKNYRRHP